MIDFSKNADNALACIFSVAGFSLTDQERRLFEQADPFGFILFGRNCEAPEQLKALIADLKETLGRDCPVLIDQEGGRIQRLKPPHWQQHHPMKYYGDLWRHNPPNAKVRLKNDTDRLCAELGEIGFNVNCAPVMDVLTEQTHEIIGDRAFSDDPDIVTALGEIVCRAFLDNHITPILKHVPGHGRALSDSHLELPVVDAPLDALIKTDFKPFMGSFSPAVWAMTAHIIFSAIDPDLPISISKKGVTAIRETIGFGGILVGDDLDMKALDAYGSVPERAIRTLEAGCDLALYCWADLKIMEEIAKNCPKLSAETLKRLQNGAKMWDKVA